VRAGRGEREHLDVDAGGIHVSDAVVPELTQPLANVGRGYNRNLWIEVGVRSVAYPLV